MEAGERLAFPSAHAHLPLKAAAERTKLNGTRAGNVCKLQGINDGLARMRQHDRPPAAAAGR
jgi:hypothetical protein